MKVNKINIFKMSLIAAVGLIFAFLGIPEVFADGSSFSVLPVYPEQQQNGEVGYFDVLTEPNAETPLTLKLVNNSDSFANIRITANDAVTNSNGIVDYTLGPADEFYARHMNPRFTELLDHEEDLIELGPGEETNVTFTLKTPEEPFKGEILGGFYLIDEDDEGTVSQAEGNMSIRNKFAYNIAALITEGDVEGIEPSFSYIDTTIGQINYRNVVFANVLNDTPMIQESQKIESLIYPEDKTDGEPLFKQELEGPKFAPQSAFPFPVYLNDIHFEPGTYTIKTILTDVNGKEWEFISDFEITKEEAKTYNDEVVSFSEPQQVMPKWLIVVIVVLAIAVIGLVVYVVINKNK